MYVEKHSAQILARTYKVNKGGADSHILEYLGSEERKYVDMIKINYDTINIIKQVLKVSVTDENCEQIHGALAAAKGQMIPRQELVYIYLELAAHHKNRGNLLKNIDILDEASDLSKADYSIIYQLTESLKEYWTEHGAELCEVDLVWLSQYLQKIDDDLSESKMYFALKGKLNRLYSLINKVRRAKPQREQIAETKHTFFLSQLTTKQYEDVSPEERKQRVAKILGKRLKQLYKDTVRNPEDDAKDTSNAS